MSVAVLTVLLAASPVQPSLEAGTWFPALVGGRVSVELPLRLQVSTTLGVMPDAYLDATQSVLVAAQAYDELTASLIDAALKNSVLFRAQVGWRPFADAGFSVQAGYGFAALGGGLTGAELIAAVTGKTLSNEARVEVTASAFVHQLTVEIGWQWFVWKGLFVRASLGGFFSFASSTQLTAPTLPSRAQQSLEPVLVEGEHYLDDTITTYVHAPVIGLTIGYQLFK